MCSKMRFWAAHLLWPCLEHLLNALAPQNSPAGPTATWEAHSRSHTSDPLGLTEKSCHRRSTRRAPFHWLDRVLSAQPTGDFRSMPSDMTLPSARLGPIEISTVWTQPLRLKQHSVLKAFWNPRLRSSINQNHQVLKQSLNLLKTVDWTQAKTTDHADKMLQERTFHHCFGQRSSASSKRLLAAISLVSGCPHEIIEAQWQLTWTLPTGLHGMWFNLWHFDCN